MRHGIFTFFLALVAMVFAGCSKDGAVSTPKVEAVNLDVVLDSFQVALKTPDPKAKAAASAAPASAAPTSAAAAGSDGAPSAAPTSAAAAPATEAEAGEDPDRTKAFLARFGSELNSRKLDGANPVGVYIRNDGAIEGFRDANKNDARDSGEPQLFWLEIDAQRNRVIVSQIIGGQPYRRPYRTSGLATGLMGGYILGRMMGRQGRFYRGKPRPRFGAMKMSPKGYHKSAMTKARSAAKSKARAKGGSRGFKGGK